MTEIKEALSAHFDIPSIGVVRSDLSGVMGKPDYEAISVIELDPCWEDGLNGIEQFSHLWVIYYQHERSDWMRQRGWDSAARAIVPKPDTRAGFGIFTIRAPCRPAGLGSCIVRLVECQQNRLLVTGLDAISGTPVLDLKVYVPAFDAFPDATMPENWITGMQKRYQCEK